MLTNSTFKPAWWLPHYHLQTIIAKLLRKHLVVSTVDQRLELDDGDFIDICWTELPKTDESRDIVVVLHGLEGSKNSHYAKGMLQALQQAGYIAVLMHFRGCSDEPNRFAASYHSGDIRDISFFTDYLKQHYGEQVKALVGFSLGGNVAVRYLAANPSNPYQAVVVICPPLDLASCCKKINIGSAKVYQHYLLKMLKDSAQLKIDCGLINHIDATDLVSLKTVWQFDHAITAPLNGFTSAEDYYQRASGGPVLNSIKQACLVIHAQDDPFLSHADIIKFVPTASNVEFEVSEHGGHVGFISGNNPFKPQYWLEQKVINYLVQQLGGPRP